MIARGFLLAGDVAVFAAKEDMPASRATFRRADNFGLAREMYKIDWSATRV